MVNNSQRETKNKGYVSYFDVSFISLNTNTVRLENTGIHRLVCHSSIPPGF